MPEAKITFQEFTDWFFDLAKVKTMPSTPIRKIYMASFNKVFGDLQVDDINPTFALWRV